MQKLTPKENRIEFILVALIFIAMGDGFALLVSDPSAGVDRFESGQLNWAARLMAVPAFLYAISIVLINFNEFLRLLLRNKLISGLHFFCMLSILWSMSAEISGLRVLLLFFTYLFSVSLFMRFERRDFIMLIALMSFILVAVQLVTVLFFNDRGMHHDMHFPAVRGLFPHKNLAGRTLVFGVLAGAVLCLDARTKKIGLLTLAIGIGGVIVTLSTSAFALMIGALIFVPSLRFVQRLKSGKDAFLVIIIVVCSALALSILLSFSDILSYIFSIAGKDVSLTGRTGIWYETILRTFDYNPILGMGYEAFWRDPTGAAYWWDSGYFIPGHAHNGYIHVFSNIGFLGLILTLMILFQFARRSLKNYRNYFATESVYTLAFLLLFLITNITEPSILYYSNLIWVQFVYLSLRES
jgi:O-antigen ligase